MVKFKEIRILESQKFGVIHFATDDQGEPWFIASEVAQALGIKRHRDALYRNVPKEFRKTVTFPMPGRGNRNHTAINLYGVLELAGRSYKSLDFIEWFLSRDWGRPKIKTRVGACQLIRWLMEKNKWARHWAEVSEKYWKGRAVKAEEAQNHAENDLQNQIEGLKMAGRRWKERAMKAEDKIRCLHSSASAIVQTLEALE